MSMSIPNLFHIFFHSSIWVFPKIGKTPKMDGENHGKPQKTWKNWGENPLFLKTPICINHPPRTFNFGCLQSQPETLKLVLGLGMATSKVICEIPWVKPCTTFSGEFFVVAGFFGPRNMFFFWLEII